MSELLEVEYVRRRERITPARAAVFIIDLQERLVSAMPTDVVAQVIRNTELLITAATQFMLPVVVSQQYPKGLGPTLPLLAAALDAAQDKGVDVFRFDKVEFSAAATEDFQALPPAQKTGPIMQREQWLIAGMETHVCVYQTVRDLIGPACAVHVLADAVCSRTKPNWRMGLNLCREMGAQVTSTEAVVFDLLQRAGSDAFKTLAKQLK